jgi:hypothetical protein
MGGSRTSLEKKLDLGREKQMTLFRLGETVLRNSLRDEEAGLRISPEGAMALPGRFGAHPERVRLKQAQ